MARGMAIQKSKGQISKSKRAGLVFPVARVHKYLKKSSYFKKSKISQAASVYLTAVLEYLSSELLELAGSTAKSAKRKLLNPRHILLAIHSDQEMKEALPTIIIPQGGVLPKINPFLISKLQHQDNKTTLSNSTNSSKIVSNAVAAAITHAHNSNKSKLKKAPSYVVLTERTFEKKKKLCVVKGDVTQITVDAVVHPTNGSYSTMGMVGSALMACGGADFVNSLCNLPSLDFLQAHSTKAHGLKAKEIIHVHGPSFSRSRQTAVSDLETAVTSCINEAERKNFKTLALPSIGSGNAGYPKHLAAQTILATIRRLLRDNVNSTLEVVYFVLFDDESVKVYETELAKLQ